MGIRPSLGLLVVVLLALTACKQEVKPDVPAAPGASGSASPAAGTETGGSATPGPANTANDTPLPTEGPGDPSLTYELVSKDPAKYRGKRVTWAFFPLSSEGKQMMCGLDEREAMGPQHAGIYVVEFASDQEAGDVFLAMSFKPGSTLTGTVSGSIDQFLAVRNPDGTPQKDIPKVTVPLLVHPEYKVGQPTESGSKGKG
jgi:hypothetical protein